MGNLSYIALSRQMALHSMMDVTANNMANMSTPGYKAQNVLFEEYINKTGTNGKIGQVRDAGSYRDVAQGTLSRTNNKLDVALQGTGYFGVSMPDGTTKYTRDGSFTLNDRGEIVTHNGYAVAGESGGPLTIPQGATSITIADDGTVSTEQGVVGKLKVTTFQDEKALLADGNNLYDAHLTKEKPVDSVLVLQGMLESSNVNPVIEMNKMIEVLRMYQSTQNVLNNDHDMTMGMIDKLTKTN